MEEHFIFRGEPSERERSRERVRQAFVTFAGQTSQDMRMPRIGSLEEHLADHFVEVTPQGATLHVVTNPAQNPTWDLSFDVGPDDAVTNIIVGEDAPPPPD
jgi:hypothetical protein